MSHTLLNLPAAIAVDPDPDPITGQRGSVYIADGYGNHRVVVFDAQGNICASSAAWVRAPISSPSATAAIRIASGSARTSSSTRATAARTRSTSISRDGTFVGNIDVIPGQIGTGQEGSGTAWDIDFSQRPGANVRVHLGRPERDPVDLRSRRLAGGNEPRQPLSGFGGFGHDPGLFSFLHMMAIDSKGNIYVGETIGGNRIQKINTKTLPMPGVSEIARPSS